MAAIADVVAGPGFVEVVRAGLGIWKMERKEEERHTMQDENSLCNETTEVTLF